jgi:hypothetical protein
MSIVASPFSIPRVADSLGHASIHVLTSNPTRTSPVKRGKWVLANLLDAPPPPPPPGVGALDESPEVSASAPLKSGSESTAPIRPALRATPVWMPSDSRSKTSTPSVVGARWTVPIRSMLRGRSRTPASCAVHRRCATSSEKARSFRRALAKKLFTYAVGRAPSPKDERFLTEWATSASIDATLDDMVRAIVLSDAFSKKRVG